ncbi:MAG TPA: molybdate ABC transporter substrate-binding protein [Anaerolineaceae bacterium]|nr:molybdate ABC transporter substrate-binding protein [Anaerolineaceae bacterium]
MVGPLPAATRRVTARLLWALALLLGACAPPPARTNSAAAGPATLDVYAAASLSGAFDDIGRAFAGQTPGVEMRHNFAGSQAVAQQIINGAPADVFASADARQMDAVVASGLIAAEDVHVFARNHLVIIVPPDNPAGIGSLADLAQPGLALVLAAEEVPLGAYSRQMLGSAAALPEYGADFASRVLANVVSLEDNVRAVVTKVALGEADAGIAYANDAAGDAVVGWVAVPAGLDVTASYYLAAVAKRPNRALADQYVDFVLSEQGQAILAENGLVPGGN